MIPYLSLGGWAEFLLALLLFFVSHALPARPPIRRRLVAVLGLRGYLVAYSLLSVLLLGWLVVASANAPFVPLWDYAPWQAWVPILVMPVVTVLLVFGLGSANPLSMSAVGSATFDAERPGIVAVVRHPVLWAALLWAVAHLVPNGDLAHVVLFGLLALLAAGGMLIFDRRQRRRLGEAEWQRLSAYSSNVPFLALFRGTRLPSPRHADLWRLAAALLLYALLYLAHGPVIGVPPVPMG